MAHAKDKETNAAVRTGQTPDPSALIGSIQSSMMQANTRQGASLPIGETSRGILSWFDREARTHKNVMAAIRDVTIETLEGISAASMIAEDYVANALDAEETMERIVIQHQDSQMALSAAPVYIQAARRILTNECLAIANAGTGQIVWRIQHR